MKNFIRLLSFTLTFNLLPFTFVCFAQNVRQPNVAGTFYPDNPDELSQTLDNFLNEANPEPATGDILAIISPHAGYEFSGRVAAYGYKLIKNKPYKTVVIIGPTHHYAFRGASVYSGGIFKTPLGDLEVDEEFTRQLLYKDKDIFFEQKFFEREHSIEVQLPFLQKTLTDFKIVPIVMGDCDIAICQQLADLLKEAIGERKDILIIASTDMYHGNDYQLGEITDELTLSYLNQMEPQILHQKLNEGKVQLCGGIPVVSAMLTTKKSGHSKLKVLKYTNSAFVTGRRIKGAYTVGYTSCVIEREGKGEREMLNGNQKKRLLQIARSSIETYLKTGKPLELTQEQDSLLLKEMGAFVTLHKHGELRGCIGRIISDKPLYLTVRDMAVESATGDPRFPAVELKELKDIEIEISALSPLKKVSSADEIQLGVHGVLIKQGFRSGVFLPQVALETGWSKEEFLSNLCAHKAGLAPNDWKDGGAEIYIFSAEVFSEKEIK